MKKKVMCMLLTGMLAASVLAGCGSNEADTDTDANAGAQVEANSGDVAEDEPADDAAEDTTGSFDNTSAVAVYSREDGSGTRGAFIELFGIEEKDENGDDQKQSDKNSILFSKTLFCVIHVLSAFC